MLSGEFAPDIFPNFIDKFAVNHGIRSCKVNKLKHAMCRMRLASYLVALKAVTSKDYHLAWLHIPDKRAIESINGYTFRENSISSIDFSKAERLESERIPHGIESAIDMDY